MTEEDITAMREAVETMDANMGDPVAFIAADHELHMALARATQNRIILALVDSIVEVLQEQRMHIYRVEGGPQRGQRHHKRILQAIESRDPEAARTEMEAHLKQVKKDSATPVDD